MPLTLDIIPHVPSLDMYGTARPGTAYSLSGEIVLTLSASSSTTLFGSGNNASAGTSASALRPSTIYLSSLLLTFEGKVEILSQNCGYAPYRVCNVEKDLISQGKPIALTNRGQKNGVMRWSMTFDLPIPAWIPATISVDEQCSGTSYSLHAHAKFADDVDTARSAVKTSPADATSASATSVPNTTSTSSSAAVSSYFSTVPGFSNGLNLSAFNPFSSFSRPKVRHAQAAPVTIKVNRFRAPKSLNPFAHVCDLTAPLVPPQIYHPTPSMFPVILESMETRVNVPIAGKEIEEEKKIPMDVLRGIEIVAGVPDFVGLSEEKVPLSVRVRSSNEDSVNKGLVLEAFDVEVEQIEKFRSIPCERYISSFPCPPASEQPPNQPLLVPNPLEGLFTYGMASPVPPVQWTRTVPMLPTKRVNFRPSPATGGLEVDKDWAKMDLTISVLRKSDTESENGPSADEGERPEERSGRNLRRQLLNPDYDSPLCRIRHELKISMKLSWLPEEAAKEIDARFKRAGQDLVTGERIRRARMAHKDRKTETLLMSIPIKLAHVSEGVERLYKMLGVHYGAAENAGPSVNRNPLMAPAMLRSLAQSRSASPAPSSRSSGVSSTGSSPANGVVSLPPVAASALMSRSGTPIPPGGFPPSPPYQSHAFSASNSSVTASNDGLMPYLAAVAAAFPGPFVLPPYSELYHANGDRKECDTWLPPYVEKEDLGPPAEPEEQDIGLAF